MWYRAQDVVVASWPANEVNVKTWLATALGWTEQRSASSKRDGDLRQFIDDWKHG